MYKKLFTLLFSVAFCFTLNAQEGAYDKAEAQTGPIVPIIEGPPQYEAPLDILYDNGPLVNAPGGGFGGADASVLQTSLGMTLYGFGHQVVNNNSMADDFEVTGSGWTIDEMQFFAYQTGSGTTSTINDIRVQIWDGDPSSGGTVIWGDMTTNRLASSTFSNIYRSIDTDPLASNRPIMVQTATIGTTLSPGTYWVQWQTGGSLASGPWAPPITINGQTTTGNGLQNLAGVWGQALDGSFPQGLPFIVLGTGPIVNTFFDDFDSYVTGQQLACQTTNWTTWSNLPCDPTEDPYVSSNYAYSGANTVVIAQNNDLVRVHGSQTSGTWYISFLFYIPTGKSGYFNTLSQYTPNPFQWAMECYFDVGGTGRLLNGATVNFTWVEATWNQALVVINLDTHNADFYCGTTDPLNLVATWDWTRAGTITNQIDANDFFGAAATDEMYVDNYYFTDQMPPIIPVELTSFTASSSNGQVVLNWVTATELNNQMFEIQRSTENTEFATIGFVNGAGTTTEEQHYTYTDRNVNTGSYSYRLKQIDYDGTFSYSDVVNVDVEAPLTFALAQNFPNPFNPSTIIQYSVPQSSNVKLAVYNAVGEEVAVLVNGFIEQGVHNVTFDAASHPSGVYFYKLQSGATVEMKKMMLMK